MLELSYRQMKRLWRRYREVGRKGLSMGMPRRTDRFTELKEPMPKIAESLPPAARAMVVRKAKKDHPWSQTLPECADPNSHEVDRSTARWDAPLRFALTTGLRFASQRQHKLPKRTFLTS